jgi:hypothetical protein
MRVPDSIWIAIASAEDEHGDAAETFARGEAAKAAANGDAELEAAWQGAADQLHTLHSINQEWTGASRVPRQGAI